MQAASKLGLRPLIIFNYANKHYDGGVAPHTEEGRQAFARYCRELMSRYGTICRHWEVWNEPNIGFWKPKPNPADYTELLKTVYQTVKAASSWTPSRCIPIATRVHPKRAILSARCSG
jgi:beta-glucosidase/6-phospho-beta-glucosidase/beta-galactosidase